MLTIIEEPEKRLYLDQSTLSNVGLGVFANTLIKKGDHIEIIGVMVEKGSIADQCTHFANDYKFAAARENHTRNVIPVGYGGMVNHAPDKKGQNVAIDYISGPKRSEHASKLVLKVIRDIFPGEELLHYYGDNWNDRLKWKAEAMSIVDNNDAEWEKFLSYKLYNFDLLEKYKPE